MGWDGAWLGDKSPKQRIIDDNTWESPNGKHEVLACMGGGATYYLACRRTIEVDGAPQSLTYALVVLSKKDKNGMHWTKEIDEGMGPNETACPITILNMLDPPTNEYAREWRDRCRAYHERQSQKAEIGDTIRFTEPISFTDGHTESIFIVTTYQRRRTTQTVFQSQTNGRLYRITEWKKRSYQIERNNP